MSIAWLFLLFALVHLTLLVLSFRWLQGRSPRSWLVRALLVGMTYDNLILFLGPWATGSEGYLWANYPRYLLHAALLPLLTPFAVSAMQVSNIRLATHRGFVGVAWAFTVVALAWGLFHDVWSLELAMKEFAGHTRLASTAALPPIATIATNVVVLPMAAMVWRAAGWKWFFLGALFIFLVNGASGAQPWGLVAGNAAEVVFILSLLRTERFLEGR